MAAFDITKLALGEVDKIETLTGQSVAIMGEDDTPKGKMLAAFVFVMKRREQLAAGEKPSFTFNDALALPFTEAQAYLGLDDDTEDAQAPDELVEDPTESEA